MLLLLLLLALSSFAELVASVFIAAAGQYHSVWHYSILIAIRRVSPIIVVMVGVVVVIVVRAVYVV